MQRVFRSILRPLAIIVWGALSVAFLLAYVLMRSMGLSSSMRDFFTGQFGFVIGLIILFSLVFSLAQLWNLVGKRFIGHFARYIGTAKASTQTNSCCGDDDRDIAVYLRPFSTDGTNLQLSSDDEALAKRGKIQKLDDTISLEEIVQAVFSDTHRFVAIGRPSEVLPPLGAERLYPSEWRASIRVLLDTAGIVVIVLGDSPGVFWELEAVIDADRLRNTIILVPPERRASARKIWERWTLTLAKADARCRHLPENVILIVFSNNGCARFLTLTDPETNAPVISVGHASTYFSALREVCHILRLRAENGYCDIDEDLGLIVVDSMQLRIEEDLGFKPPSDSYEPASDSFKPPSEWKGD